MVTQNKLKEVLNYNPETGVFTWIKRNQEVAGYLKPNGYRGITIKDTLYNAHTLAWIYVYGEVPPMLDHIDHNKDNNSILNLRVINCAENSKNMKQNKNNKSGIVGVSFHKTMGKWEANITVNMLPIKLGFFKDIHLAIKARQEAEKKYGFHPNHGENYINYEYINEMQKYIHDNKKGEANKIKVAQLLKDGTFVKEFNSAKEAGKELGIQRSHIGSVCKGYRKTAGGFKWQFV
jgi:hypothetical protein